MGGGFGAELSALARDWGPGPVLVHADLARAMRAVEPVADRRALCERHIETLSGLADGRALWFPTFHYAFTTSGRFDVVADVSEVGALSEHARTHWASWRTPVPVFSMCGSGGAPAVACEGSVDPFGADSIFAELVGRDGTVLCYGASLATATILHFAERRSGGPLYRYDKRFPGRVIAAEGSETEVELVYHVRPRDSGLEYAWPRIERELLEAGVGRPLRAGSSRVLSLSARTLVAFWEEWLKADPLHLLDAGSRDWVSPRLAELGRRFELRDFEDVEELV